MDLFDNSPQLLLFFLIILCVIVIVQIRLVMAIFTIKSHSIKQTKLMEAQMRLIGLKMEADNIPINDIDVIMREAGYTYTINEQSSEHVLPKEPWK